MAYARYGKRVSGAAARPPVTITTHAKEDQENRACNGLGVAVSVLVF